jgi:uncharacterized protein (DUF302 family)
MNKLALTAGLILSLTAGAAQAKERAPLILASQSPHDQATTIKRLHAAAKKLGWKIPKVFDLQATMKKHGHKVGPVQVVNICKPALAARLLSVDKHRHLSVMMPCRISVYTDSKGKTHVSRFNPAALAGIIKGEAAQVMGAAGKGLEKVIAAAFK